MRSRAFSRCYRDIPGIEMNQDLLDLKYFPHPAHPDILDHPQLIED